jgi:hypothetical protein
MAEDLHEVRQPRLDAAGQSSVFSGHAGIDTQRRRRGRSPHRATLDRMNAQLDDPPPWPAPVALRQEPFGCVPHLKGSSKPIRGRNLARLVASRRSVLIRSPGLRGIATEPRRRTHAPRGSTGVESHNRKVRPHSRTEVRSRHATASSPEPSQLPACSRSCLTRAHHPARPPRQAPPRSCPCARQDRHM